MARSGARPRARPSSQRENDLMKAGAPLMYVRLVGVFVGGVLLTLTLFGPDAPARGGAAIRGRGLGVRVDRKLAMAHGHAPERGRHERSAQRRGTARGRTLG